MGWYDPTILFVGVCWCLWTVLCFVQTWDSARFDIPIELFRHCWTTQSMEKPARYFPKRRPRSSMSSTMRLGSAGGGPTAQPLLYRQKSMRLRQPHWLKAMSQLMAHDRFMDRFLNAGITFLYWSVPPHEKNGSNNDVDCIQTKINDNGQVVCSGFWISCGFLRLLCHCRSLCPVVFVLIMWFNINHPEMTKNIPQQMVS